MKEIQLTKGYVAVVDDEDYDRVNQHKWHVSFSKCGNIYACHNRRTPAGFMSFRMHRFILGLNDLKIRVDHKDGNGLNNRRENLRLATSLENNRNKKHRKDNKSGFRGVYWHKGVGKYAAQIRVNGKAIHLGYFDDPVKASRIYEDKAKETFKEFYRPVGQEKNG